jgi:hypothetical protein
MFGRLFSALIFIMTVLGFVRVFEKAGRAWWEALVPVYNIYILTKIVGKPGWWTVLFFIPLVNIVIGFIVLHKLCKLFGKGTWFAIGLFFFPIIFYPILGLGDSEFHGAHVAAEAPQA